jgi:hypothetical protein
MVINERGQNTTEYLFMLALMTVVGLLIMKSMIGTDHGPQAGTGGAITKMAEKSAKSIADDEHP